MNNNGLLWGGGGAGAMGGWCKMSNIQIQIYPPLNFDSNSEEENAIKRNVIIYLIFSVDLLGWN